MLVTVPRPADAADETLLLDVQVNSYSIGKIGTFVLRNGALLSQRAELRDLGFQVPAGLPAGPDGLIALADLKGLTWRLDLPNQKLYITATNDRLLPALLRVGGAPGVRVPVESGTGATINYDLNGTSVAGQTIGTGSFDMRAFSPFGVVSSGELAYVGGGPGGVGTNSAIRLDSLYTYSDPDTLRRYRLGDYITDGLSWTRPIRLLGVQIDSDFALRPDLVTFPLPTVSGSVAVPSTVNVLANGTQLISRQIAAGPFEIPQLPVVTGAGSIALTVTDALGKQVAVTLPFYASSELLAPGLQSYAMQAGLVRQNWGVISNDYEHLAGVASYRRGLSNWLTVEASAEGTGGTAMAGGGFVVNLDNLAVLNAAVAASAGSGQSGKQYAIGIQRQGKVFSVGASATAADQGFRDVAAMSGDPVPRLQLNANVGMSLGRFGSVGVAYTAIDNYTVPAPIQLFVPPGTILPPNTVVQNGMTVLQPAQHTHVGTASYSVQLYNVSMYATAFRDFAGGAAGILVGLTIPLGTRSSANVSAGSGASGGYQQVQVQQSASEVGDWGYQAFGGTGNPAHEFGQLQYKSPWALLTAGADHVGPQTTVNAEAQGAVSYVDGGIFPSNTINDSFGVVDTGGLANVRVLYENRLVGRTDAAGLLLVPDLRSFDVNHLAIDPTDIPLDTSVGAATRTVRPQDRSGVVVKFGVKVSHGALLRLVDAAGKRLPVGSVATLRATGTAYPVGYDGDAYVEGLAPHNDLAVELPGGHRCRVTFDYQPVKGDIPAIGPLRCQEAVP